MIGVRAMNMGTMVYDNQIYNLDYMSSEEIKILLEQIEKDKKQNILEMKLITK